MIIISFIIPTLNSEKVLKKCLDSITNQNYPRSKYEILILDGGSTDKTLSIAKVYKSIIYKNPLKTAEAGKAVGVKKAKGKYLALIDSDNILPNKNWLNKMLLPLEKDSQIIGSEPIRYTYRPSGGYMERYSALTGVNDPYALISDVYDRQNLINGQWTGLKIDQIDNNQYIKIILKPKKNIPTIGANGTIFRSAFLKDNLKSNYLFDIDIISQVINETQKPIFFAKVKIGIIHTFCESSLKKFAKKQNRRLVDFYTFQNERQYNWSSVNKNSQIKFVLYSILIIPSLIDSIRGFAKKPDLVWFLHPIICLITLLIYIYITVKFKLGILKPINRSDWKQ